MYRSFVIGVLILDPVTDVFVTRVSIESKRGDTIFTRNYYFYGQVIPGLTKYLKE